MSSKTTIRFVLIGGLAFLAGYILFAGKEGFKPSESQTKGNSLRIGSPEEVTFNSPPKSHNTETLEGHLSDSLMDRKWRQVHFSRLSQGELREFLNSFEATDENKLAIGVEVAAALGQLNLQEGLDQLEKLGGLSQTLPIFATHIALKDFSAGIKLVAERGIDVERDMLQRLVLQDPEALSKAVANGELQILPEATRCAAAALAYQTGQLTLDQLKAAGIINETTMQPMLVELAKSGGGGTEFLLGSVMPNLDSTIREDFIETLAQHNPHALRDLQLKGFELQNYSALLESPKTNPNLFLEFVQSMPSVARRENAIIIGERLGYEQSVKLIGDTDENTRKLIANGAFVARVSELGGAAALSEANVVSDPAARDAGIRATIKQWAKSEPNSAANAIVEGQYGEMTAELLGEITPLWRQLDPNGVDTWLEALKSSRPDIVNQLIPP